MIDLTAKREAAKAALDAAKAALTDDDKSEIAVREEIASLEEERQTVEQTKRDVDLARRLDAAQESLGESAKMRSVSPKEFDDTFIVVRNGKAYSDFRAGLQAIGQGKKLSQSELERKYAVACIYDWNGHTDFSEILTAPDKANVKGVSNTMGAELYKYLTENPGVVTPILDAVAELAGVFARERKS